MKKVLLLALFFYSGLFAQVGISNVDPKAQLDISASNAANPSNIDGILIPRVNVFPAINPTIDQNGMMVFLTAAVGTNQPGFYYWNQPTTSWIGVGRTTANQWNLSGNNGTTPAANFIGTTDNQDLVFRRNNILAGKITNGNTFFGSGSGSASTATLNTYIGTEAGQLNVNGSQNVFLGRLAGGSGATGSDNIFIGNAAGLTNTANNNLFMGSFSGNTNTTGGGNMFIGNLSGSSNSSGGQNTFVGLSTGNVNTVGSANTLLGNNTDLNANNLTNATAIGANATVAASNALVLGSVNGINSATSSTNVGIGTTTPLGVLDVTAATGGVLVPRVALTSPTVQAPVVNPQGGNIPESTLIYNTATTFGPSATVVKPGFHYWTGTRWSRIDAGGQWKLQGNSGTNSSTDFIGTTDTSDLTFRRNNIVSGSIGATNTAFGFNSHTSSIVNNRNTAIGAESLQSTFVDDNTAVGYSALGTSGGDSNTAVGSSAMANASGDFNVAIGANALPDGVLCSRNTIIGFESAFESITGDDNTTLGYRTLHDNFSGSQNVAIGADALNANTTGSFNVAMGVNALSIHLSGSGNTAVGHQAMNTVLSGSGNTALGNMANFSGALSNATAIGNLAFATASNSLVLGSIAGVNTATASTRVGIGTTNPQSPLEIVAPNVVTDGAVRGNLHVMTNNPQAIDIGASITLGGQRNDAATSFRVFGAIEGRKTDNTSTSSDGYLILKTDENGNLLERMRITHVGRVGIGTSTPGGLFELSLNEGRKPGTNTWTIASDQRLKTVAGNYEKGLDEIVQLQPVKYRYHNVPDKKFDEKVLNEDFVGFLAQKVQPLFPEAVGTDEDGYLNFNLHPILIASVNAIKSLHQKNAELEAKLQQQAEKYEILKAELDSQKRLLESIQQ